MAFSTTAYAEDTDFERFVLDVLGTHRIRIADPTAIHDIRGKKNGGGNIFVKVGAAAMGGGGREQVVRSLRPLGFGAAYKVLDLLVEHVLRANGATSGKLPFQQKSQMLTQRPAILPVPLDTRPDLWDRLAKLYNALQEARHAVTHRRATATAAGDLEIYDANGQLIDTVSSNEISSFAAAIHATSELVIEGQSDDRRLNIIAWHTNALQPRHGSPLLNATDPNADRRLLEMDLIELGDGRLRFDVPQAKKTVDGQTPSLWDLRLHAAKQVFVGHWEDVANHETPVDFDPASPPQWLSEEISAA